MDDLKPCPFCGGKAAFVPRAANIVLQKDLSDPKFGVSVICGKCGSESPNVVDEARAAEFWNRRASGECGYTARAAGVTGLSDFIRNAAPERKAEVYGRVMDKVAERQQAVIDAARYRWLRERFVEATDLSTDKLVLSGDHEGLDEGIDRALGMETCGGQSNG